MQCSSIPTTQLRRHPLETKLPSPSGHHSRRHGYESMRLALLYPVVNYFLTGEASPSTSAVAGAAPLCLFPSPSKPARAGPLAASQASPEGVRVEAPSENTPSTWLVSGINSNPFSNSFLNRS